MSPHRIKDEKLREIYDQISSGRGGLYKLWNYVEDLDLEHKELIQDCIDEAMAECFLVMGHIHVLNETWKLPVCGYVPPKGDENG